MLSYLIRNRGRVVLRDELLKAVWGYRRLPYTRTVDVHIWQLRRKLEADPQRPHFPRTIRGTGYLFVEPATSRLGRRISRRRAFEGKREIADKEDTCQTG